MYLLLYCYKKGEPLNEFIDRQLSESSAPNRIDASEYEISKDPNLTEQLQIKNLHTLIVFKRIKDKYHELARINGAFSSDDVDDLLDVSLKKGESQ